MPGIAENRIQQTAEKCQPRHTVSASLLGTRPGANGQPGWKRKMVRGNPSGAGQASPGDWVTI